MAASQRLTHVLVTLALLILCVLMVLYPAETWHAGVRGLSIWWDVLFPSLFPFWCCPSCCSALALFIFWVPY